MPINHNEIIEELEGQILKCGGVWEEWCVGTAKDSRGPFFQHHREADLGDGLTYREAYTTTAAQAVVAHLINDHRLEPDRDALPEPGRLVFIYRKSPPPPRPARERSRRLPSPRRVARHGRTEIVAPTLRSAHWQHRHEAVCEC
jgi:hypothetical protein